MKVSWCKNKIAYPLGLQFNKRFSQEIPSQFIVGLIWRSLVLYFTIILLASISFCQTDVVLSTIGPYQTLATGASWGSGGLGSTDNSYIFTPISSASITCVFVKNNNPSSGHTVNINFYTTPDPTVKKYATVPSLQSSWRKVGSTVAASIAANTLSVFGFPSVSAAWAQVQLTGSTTASGSPDTADIRIVQSNTNLDCASSAIPIAGTVTISNILNIPSCNLSAFNSVASGATINLIAAPGAGNKFHICAFTVGGDVITNGQTVSFQDGTTGTCSSPGATEWSVSPHTGGSNYNVGAGIGQLFQTQTANQPLCVTAGAIGATQFVSVSYMVGP